MVCLRDWLYCVRSAVCYAVRTCVFACVVWAYYGVDVGDGVRVGVSGCVDWGVRCALYMLCLLIECNKLNH